MGRRFNPRLTKRTTFKTNFWGQPVRETEWVDKDLNPGCGCLGAVVLMFFLFLLISGL